jgi:LytS/YehU family sensor histidine kinase
MADRLTVVLELPEALAEIKIPPLLLQPLVENSVKHGLEPAIAGGRIKIKATREGEDLLLSVRDTGVGLAAGSSPPTGGDPAGGQFSLSLASAPDADGGTLVVVRLPLKVR